MGTIYRIYSMRHPDSKEAFYVGRTTMELKDRCKMHVFESLNAKKPNRKQYYIRKMIKWGDYPIIELLDVFELENTNCYCAEELEKRWISMHLNSGHRLLNVQWVEELLQDKHWPHFYCAKITSGYLNK